MPWMVTASTACWIATAARRRTWMCVAATLMTCAATTTTRPALRKICLSAASPANREVFNDGAQTVQRSPVGGGIAGGHPGARARGPPQPGTLAGLPGQAVGRSLRISQHRQGPLPGQLPRGPAAAYLRQEPAHHQKRRRPRAAGAPLVRGVASALEAA